MFNFALNIAGAMSYVWLILYSMAEEPAQTPASPTDSEDIGITIGRPKVRSTSNYLMPFPNLLGQGQFPNLIVITFVYFYL